MLYSSFIWVMTPVAVYKKNRSDKKHHLISLRQCLLCQDASARSGSPGQVCSPGVLFSLAVADPQPTFTWVSQVTQYPTMPPPARMRWSWPQISQQAWDTRSLREWMKSVRRNNIMTCSGAHTYIHTRRHARAHQWHPPPPPTPPDPGGWGRR